MLNIMEVSQYLSRIGINDRIALRLSDLNMLIQAQLTHVPFENLDIWSAGGCPSLRVEDLFDKIVTRRRGGYCFELNTLFRELLNSLGFNAYQAIACLIHEDDKVDPPAHNVIICKLNDTKYLIDVGFGGPVPYGALELKCGNANGFDLDYQDGYWVLERENGEKPSLRFRDIPATVLEMEPLNFYISQKSDSHFRHILRINQRKPDGTVCALIDGELRIHTDTQTQSRTICDPSEMKMVLQTYFGMAPGTYQLRNT